MELVQRHASVSKSDRGVTMIAILVVVRIVVDGVMTALVVSVKMPMVDVAMCAIAMSVPMLSRCSLYLKNGDDRECGDHGDGLFRHVFYFVVVIAQRQERTDETCSPVQLIQNGR